MKSSLKQALLFILVSLGISLPIYQDAMWGKSLLAPLDLGPAIFTEFQHMDPDFGGIPDNHFIVDQFTYDLPLQKRIYESHANGEIPWWDPYTYGGRPLLADAHINGTDPIRVACYLALPFELAYNWNLIIRGVFTGLGLYLLLRRCGIRPAVSGILGITYQYAGWFTMYFGHPWIQGSFVYFPYLWLVWLEATQNKFGSYTALGGILCAGVFYAGNLQSHTYLPIFAFAFLFSTVNGNRKFFLKALATTAISGVVGALLAYPVLVNQIEFLLLTHRGMDKSQSVLAYILNIPVSLMGFFPWFMGTFRTFSATSAFGVGNIGFNLFFGSLSGLLVIIGACRLRKVRGMESWFITQSVFLIAIYLLIISTPIGIYLYPRSAALAGIGIAVLGGLAMERILAWETNVNRFTLLSFGSLVTCIAILGSLAAWFVYPHFVDAITEKVMKELPNRPGLSSSSSLTELRLFQIRNFSSEVSLRNPEVALSFVAVLSFIYALLKAPVRYRNTLLIASLLASSLPVLMFHARFRPKHPVSLWHKMEEGGASHKRVIALAANDLRIDETDALPHDNFFPHAMASLYGVHALHGYSALQPPSLFRLPPDSDPSKIPEAWVSDIRHNPLKSGEWIVRPGEGSSRFRMAKSGEPAPVSVIRESMNSLSLDTAELPKGETFVKTDTWYPGWYAKEDTVTIKHLYPCFSTIRLDNETALDTITLTYKPTGLRGVFFALGTGFFILLALVCLEFKRSLLTSRRQKCATN